MATTNHTLSSAPKKNDAPPAQPYIGSFDTDYRRVSISRGDAVNFATMRTAQLSSLLHLIVGEGFETFSSYNEEIQGNILWLAADLAEDVKHVTTLVQADAREQARDAFGGVK